MKLEIGYNHDFEVRNEVCRTTSGCEFTVLYLSDLHLTRFSGPTVRRLTDTIARLNPRVLLLGGDYADGPKGFAYFTQLLEAVADREYVCVIPGNHDVFFGVQKLRRLVEAHHLVWLAEQPVTLCLDGHRVQITSTVASDRAEAVDFRILCLHKPVDITAVSHQYDLAFAGHLHGCQFVFWQSAKGLFPGRFFYRWNRLKATVGTCLYLISKGLGDTLPVRYNCKRDVVFVTVQALHTSPSLTAL
ncbi:metallophosphoesterase [Hymenobacter sp. BT507]|uniref:Metallophosphoesterase n=1 Tax=Hymenobacter citatus TaxID=2763506 RepID=A0ABR7MK36_9BACT|nr:metallophosphoesterase [Hymenobacter citatus]MBC6611439.1 metallophosphoesterase [Hymenobacter citatus]